MNGPHDLGGMMGFGPVAAEADEPVFHCEWERRAFAINLAMGMTGSWNIDAARHERELLPPDVYWRSSYYEMRHYALEEQLAKLGLASRAEEKAGRMMEPPRPVKRVAKAGAIAAILASGGPADRPARSAALFAAGDRVRTRNIQPHGHTRLPGYTRGKAGEIVSVHGAHVFPDSSAHGKGDDPHWLYTVKFSSLELWGREGGASVCADLWEPYLEAA